MSCVSPVVINSSPVPPDLPVGPGVSLADALSEIMPVAAGFDTAHVYLGYDDDDDDDSDVTSVASSASVSTVVIPVAASVAIPGPSPLRRQSASPLTPPNTPIRFFARRGRGAVPAAVNRSPSTSALRGCLYRDWAHASVRGFTFGKDGSLKLKVMWRGFRRLEYPFIEQAPHYVVVEALRLHGFDTRHEVYQYHGKPVKASNFCCNNCSRVYCDEQIAGALRMYCNCLQYTALCRRCTSNRLALTCIDCNTQLAERIVQRSM